VPLDRRCGALSGGGRAHVALAVALGSRPAVLVLDEPLAALDPVARTEVTGELMAEAADSGMTVLLSGHVVAELAGVGDHLLLLAAGRPVLAGDVDGLLAGHVRLTGPRAQRPLGPGTVVQARHTARQSTFTVPLPASAPAVPMVAPGWTTHPLSFADLVLTYLRRPTCGDSPTTADPEGRRPRVGGVPPGRAAETRLLTARAGGPWPPAGPRGGRARGNDRRGSPPAPRAGGFSRVRCHRRGGPGPRDRRTSPPWPAGPCPRSRRRARTPR
jgi:hypothetical protein